MFLTAVCWPQVSGPGESASSSAPLLLTEICFSQSSAGETAGWRLVQSAGLWCWGPCAKPPPPEELCGLQVHRMNSNQDDSEDIQSNANYTQDNTTIEYKGFLNWPFCLRRGHILTWIRLLSLCLPLVAEGLMTYWCASEAVGSRPASLHWKVSILCADVSCCVSYLRKVSCSCCGRAAKSKAQ